MPRSYQNVKMVSSYILPCGNFFSEVVKRLEPIVDDGGLLEGLVSIDVIGESSNASITNCRQIDKCRSAYDCGLLGALRVLTLRFLARLKHNRFADKSYFVAAARSADVSMVSWPPLANVSVRRHYTQVGVR
jgi:hypothetical protein